MPLWRCPHCATPQAETARCWVCRRSTTSCATCRHFRRGVTASLGFCGLDRQRRVLRGDEMRSCWAAAAELPAGNGTAAASPQAHGVRPPATLLAGAGERIARTFVPVEDVAAPARGRARSGREADGRTATGSDAGAPMTGGTAGRWSLWGDLEP